MLRGTRVGGLAARVADPFSHAFFRFSGGMVARLSRGQWGSSLNATCASRGPAGRTTAALAAVLSLTTALTATPALAAPLPKVSSAKAVPGELVLSPAARAVPRATQILNAGTTGFLWAREGDKRLFGRTTPPASPPHSPSGCLSRSRTTSITATSGRRRRSDPGWYGAGSDAVASVSPSSRHHMSRSFGAPARRVSPRCLFLWELVPGHLRRQRAQPYR